MSWVLLIIFGGVMARKGELGEEPDYYPKINPNPNNIEELTVQDIPIYFDMFNRFYEIDNKNNENLNRSYKKFTDNIKRIIIMNKFSTAAKFAINEFSHLTLEEFTDKYTGFNDTGLNSSDASPFTYNSTQEAPENLDWRTLGMPTMVRHQGPCKSSYVFSAVAHIESQMAKHFKVTLRLSEQQAYDCENSGSCKYGGLPHKVMEALKDLGGIEEQTAYVYDPQDQRECKVKENLMAVKVKTVQRYQLMYENSLIALLALYGPIVTTIYVSESVKNYHKGVLWPTDCDKKPNHAVLLVGYGITDDSVPFWIIKNSWGIMWGESGYIRLIRGEHACNIGQYVATAAVEPIKKGEYVATTANEQNYKKDKAIRAQEEPPLTGFLNNVAGAIISFITPTKVKSTIKQSSPDTTTQKAENEPITESTTVSSYEEKETTHETTKKLQVSYKLKKSHSSFKNEPIPESTPISSYEEKETTQETTKPLQIMYELKKSDSPFKNEPITESTTVSSYEEYSSYTTQETTKKLQVLYDLKKSHSAFKNEPITESTPVSSYEDEETTQKTTKKKLYELKKSHSAFKNEPITESTTVNSYEDEETTQETTKKKLQVLYELKKSHSAFKNEPITESTTVNSYEDEETTQETTKKFKVLYEFKKSHSLFKVDNDDEVTDRKPIARKKSSSISSTSSSSSESQEKSLKKYKAVKKEKISEEEETSDSGSLESDDVAYTTEPVLKVTIV